MIRSLGLVSAAVLILCGSGAAPAIAQGSATIKLAAADDAAPTSVKHKSSKDKPSKSAKAKAAKTAKKAAANKSEASGEAGKPVQLASFGDWGAFLAAGGKEKTCYVLAQPAERVPSKLKRDPAYVFISSRPGENIHNEVSITMGFPMKDGGDAEADVSGTSFDLVSKGTNAWIKNPAQEAEFIATMKKSAKLVVKAASVKGNVTTDSYSLAGLSLALQRAEKECR
jgi:hypothetical protein